MTLRQIVALLAAPTVAVALAAGGFLGGRATAPVRHVTDPVRHEIPRAAIMYAAQLQATLYLDERGGQVQKPPQVNTVGRRGRLMLVNLTIFPGPGPALQFNAYLNPKTLALVGLVQFDAAR